MEKKEEDLIKALVDHDAELRRRYEDHLEFERQLNDLNRKLYLTPEQDRSRREIQKLKLAGKDKMMQILQRHRSAVEN